MICVAREVLTSIPAFLTLTSTSTSTLRRTSRLFLLERLNSKKKRVSLARMRVPKIPTLQVQNMQTKRVQHAPHIDSITVNKALYKGCMIKKKNSFLHKKLPHSFRINLGTGTRASSVDKSLEGRLLDCYRSSSPSQCRVQTDTECAVYPCSLSNFGGGNCFTETRCSVFQSEVGLFFTKRISKA